MELILEHDSFSRNVDQEITSIAIKEEYNFTFYNGNDIKRGRIIHQWNRSYISFCRLINFTSFLVIRERDSRLTNPFILVEQFFANRFFFLFSRRRAPRRNVSSRIRSSRGEGVTGGWSTFAPVYDQMTVGDSLQVHSCGREERSDA